MQQSHGLFVIAKLLVVFGADYSGIGGMEIIAKFTKSYT